MTMEDDESREAVDVRTGLDTGPDNMTEDAVSNEPERPTDMDMARVRLIVYEDAPMESVIIVDEPGVLCTRDINLSIPVNDYNDIETTIPTFPEHVTVEVRRSDD